MEIKHRGSLDTEEQYRGIGAMRNIGALYGGGKRRLVKNQ